MSSKITIKIGKKISSFCLPFPISLNDIYVGKRHLSKKAKQWAKDAGWLLKISKPPKMSDKKIFMCVYITRKDNRIRDLDNLSKLMQDVLEDNKVYNNDSQIVGYLKFWTDEVFEDGMKIEFFEAGELSVEASD